MKFGHPQVDNDQSKLLVLEILQRPQTVVERNNIAEPFMAEKRLQQRQDVRFVVYKHYGIRTEIVMVHVGTPF